MSKKRIIVDTIRRSESFLGLDYRQRDLWHGLIVVADDQGRLSGNPAIVRSLVWPADDISLDDVSSDLETLEELGNIHLYIIDDRQYIQIVNWWQYQKMQWAGKSDYPAPEGWVDRCRYHGRGRKIVLVNWDREGGFRDQAHEQQPELMPQTSDDKKDDDYFPFDKNHALPQKSDPRAIMESVSGILTPSAIEKFEAIHTALDLHESDDVKEALQTSFDHWCETKTKSGKYYNPTNYGWVDWAIANLNTGHEAWKDVGQDRSSKASEVY